MPPEAGALAFRQAAPDDAGIVAALINTCYRGETSRLGWTTEADLLEGLRTEASEVARLIARHDTTILLCLRQNALLATVCLEKMDDGRAQLGMFAVQPALQGQGIGKALLAYAERFAKAQWQTKRMSMAVIDCRRELIAYYERRGYSLSGAYEPFPAGSGLWQLKAGPLRLAILEKPLD